MICTIRLGPADWPAPAGERSFGLQMTFSENSWRAPVVLFSHGQGLTQYDYGPLTTYLAEAGFAVIQPDHACDPSGLPRGIWHARITDMLRIISGLDALMAAAPDLEGRFDPQRIAIAGHSYGAHTAAALAGAKIRDPDTDAYQEFGAAAVRAAILLAPPGHFDGLVPEWQVRTPYLAVDWRSMRGPMLLVAGINDNSAMTELGWRWHTDAYYRAEPGHKYLILLAGAGHYLGGIDGRSRAEEAQSKNHVKLVGEAAVTFLRHAFDPADLGWNDVCSALPKRQDIVQGFFFK